MAKNYYVDPIVGREEYDGLHSGYEGGIKGPWPSFQWAVTQLAGTATEPINVYFCPNREEYYESRLVVEGCNGGSNVNRISFIVDRLGTKFGYPAGNYKIACSASAYVALQLNNVQYITIKGFEIIPNYLGIYVTGSSDYIILENNYVHDNPNSASGNWPGGIQFQLLQSTTNEIVVKNNIVANLTSHADSIAMGIFNVYSQNIFYYNNTVKGIHGGSFVSGAWNAGGIGIGGMHDSDDVSHYVILTVKNNIISDITATEGYAFLYYFHTETSTAGFSLTSDYNDLFLGDADKTARYFGTEYETLTNWQGGESQDATSIDGDPVLISEFKIAYNSPCRDTGVTISSVTEDFFEAVRPFNLIYDIGAHEYTPSSGHQIYFLDGVNGNDTNTGLSRATAWKTLQYAANTTTAAVQGTTVYVRQGTYLPTDPVYIRFRYNSGTGEGARIEFVADRFGEVWLEDGVGNVTVRAVSTMAVVVFSGADYVSFVGFTLSVNPGTWLPSGISVEFNSHHILIDSCKFHGSPSAEMNYAVMVEGTNVVVKNCLAYYKVQRAVSFYNATDCDFYNNTFVFTNGKIFYSGSSNINVYNNIFAISGGTSNSAVIATIGAVTGLNIDNNRYYKGGGYFWDDNSIHKTFADWKTAVGGDSNSSEGNPYLIDFTSNDASKYRLLSTSPCINAGVTIPSVTEDLWRNPRLAGFYDIGSHEYGNPPAPTSLTISDITINSMKLNWTYATLAEVYKVEKSTNGFTFFQIYQTLSPVELNYTATGLAEGTTYYFRVRAANVAGNGPYSDIVSAITSITPPPPPIVGPVQPKDNSPTVIIVVDPDTGETTTEVEKPNAPEHVFVSRGTGSQGRLFTVVHWGKVADAVRYEVFRSTYVNLKDAVRVQNVFSRDADGEVKRVFIDASVEEGITYFYYVVAFNAAGAASENSLAATSF